MKLILVSGLAAIALSGTVAASYVMGQASPPARPASAARVLPGVTTVPGMPPGARRALPCRPTGGAP